MDQETWTVGVDAHGIATADYDRVMFSVTAEVVAPTMTAVKEQLKKRAAAFKDVYYTIERKLNYFIAVELDSATLSTSSALGKHQVFNHKTHEYDQKGYKGVYSASFEITTIDEASLVYDALTGLDGFDVQAPQFKLRNQEQLKRQALGNAHERLLERFKLECTTMGVSFDDYQVVSWRVDYGQAGRGISPKAAASNYAAVAASGPAFEAGDHIEIQASKAVVTVYLTVTFAKKGNS